MFQHILIATDGSELSEKAIKHGVALARALRAKTTGLTVSRPFHMMTLEPGMLTDTPAAYTRHVAERTKKYLDYVLQAAKTAGIACDVVTLEHEHPYQAILDTVQGKGCDLIVMASHGRRGMSALVLGSETVKVLTHGKVPVLVCR
jgi:nucleotide-binding universal stress UspA family protein